MYPLNITYMPNIQNISCAYETIMSVYMLHMSSVQSTLEPELLVNIYFTLLGYFTNMPTTLHAYVLLHCYYSLHKDFMLLS